MKLNNISLETRGVSAAIGGYIIGGFFIISLPIWISAVIDDFGVSEGAVGILSSIEIGCVALSMLITSANIHRINRRYVALIGALIAIFANVVSANVDTIQHLGVCRIFVGLGLGAVTACTLSTAAGTNKSQRTFSVMEAVLALVASGFYIISAKQVSSNGAEGVFYLIAFFQFICIPLLFLIPRKIGRNQEQEKKTTLAIGKDVKLTKTAWQGIFANGVFYACMFSFWTFVSRIALEINIDSESLGNVLSIAFLGGLISTLSVPILTRVFGYKVSISAVMLLMAIAAFGLTNANVFLVFAAATICLKLNFLFYSTIMNGMFALEDETGRANGFGLASAIAGTTVGPALGGWVILQSGYVILGLGAIIGWILCYPFLLRLAIMADKKTTKPS